MSDKYTLKPLAMAAGIALVTSLASTSVVNAAENPFAMTELSSGYMVAEMAEGKGSEGKCGEGKCGEGKCGGDDKGAHAHGDKMMKEGKCGEGKCGGDKKSEKEGKCGEGKCGGSK